MLRSCFIYISILATCWCSCVPTDDLSEVEFANDVRSLAFPLVNTQINITDFERQNEGGNITVLADNQGRVTVQYDGEIVSRDWSIISPPLPIAAFSFEDSITNIEIKKPDGSNLLVDEDINIIEFEQWNIKYQINHNFEEDITVTFTIPQIKKDGVAYRETFIVISSWPNPTTFFSDDFPLDGYSFGTVDNEFVILYDARLPSGERVEFESSAGIFQPFNPSYVEGYLGLGQFPVQGNIVPVNLFSAWKSGGAVFENPRIDLYVENALGLPLTTDFEEFSITTIAGNDIDIEADVIENGIALDYPLLAEKGQAKITTFTFDKANSNLKELFSERVKRVNYKINALYNKEESGDQSQFIGEGGYFSANVSVVLPLEGKITDLVLNDTIDLDLGEYKEVIKGEIKSVITNEFPLDLDFQAYFIDDSGSVLDSLYKDGFILAGAPVDNSGVAIPSDAQISLTEISANQWNIIKNSTRIAFDFKLNTKNINNSPLWVYDQYDVIVKIGAILDVNVD